MPHGLAATLGTGRDACAANRALRLVARATFGAAVALTLCLIVNAARAETLIIQGSSTASTALLTPNQAAIESLSGQSLKIVSIRTDIGLLRLLSRQSEFAVISAPLKQSIASLRNAGADLPYDKLMSFPIGQVRVAFAVNPSNPVRKVDMRSIRRVLSGEIKNWKQLGGDDEVIRVTYVQAGGGVTLSVANDLFGGRPLMPANPIRVAFDMQVIRVVEQEPRALGIAQLSLVQAHQLPELMTDRAIEQELSLVTLGEPSQAQRAVIDAVRKVAADAGMPAR